VTCTDASARIAVKIVIILLDIFTMVDLREAPKQDERLIC
jgi:hypothetical protein